MKKNSGLMRLMELEIEPLSDEVLRSVMGTQQLCSIDACSGCTKDALQELCSFTACSAGDPGDPPPDPGPPCN